MPSVGFIETVRSVGYRFARPVERLEIEAAP
jgi:DNA-binding winged helix-turn-helix (wHTH) protein